MCLTPDAVGGQETVPPRTNGGGVNAVDESECDGGAGGRMAADCHAGDRRVLAVDRHSGQEGLWEVLAGRGGEACDAVPVLGCTRLPAARRTAHMRQPALLQSRAPAAWHPSGE